MPILDQDIQLLASQVLADVPEGGGAATGNEIDDGVSNNLFDDISELDRVYGDVSLRKVFVAVRTPTVDRYLGAHVIVADPPDDPDVSAVLFSTENFFDTRAEAASRIEAYLAQGPAYQGLLYGNHLAGQMTVMLIQRTNAPIPPIGTTLCLRKLEDTESQAEQYVRITDVESNEATFTDSDGDFTRLVVILSISDQLREDFPGFPATRVDAAINFTGKTRVYDTVVADAARYYGVVPLAEDIDLGDFSAQTDGIFTQLVPSSRAETPITDARMNQQQVGQGVGGSPVSRSVTAIFSSTQSLYLGGGLMPGSISISRSGITITDAGGQLYLDGTAVGAVDYENGVLSLSTDVFGGGSGAFDAVYTPGTPNLAVSESIGVRVTAANQRLTWVFTLEPPPQRATLQASYMAQGRWYVLTEDGGGGVRGSDSSFGAGNLNFETGTLALTLGAMPDVNSAVILTYVPETSSTPLVTTDFALNRRFACFVDLNSPIRPGTLSIEWDDGDPRTAEDDGNGSLTGDAAGRVVYTDGHIYFSPNLLPAPGTELTINRTQTVAVDNELTNFTDGGSTWTTTLATPVRQGSVEIAAVASTPMRVYPGVDETSELVVRIFDDGAGVLRVRSLAGNLAVGTINYGTGAVVINKSTSGFQSVQGVWANQTAIGDAVPRIVYQGQETRTTALAVLNGASADAPINPSWAWWTGLLDEAAFIRYASTDASTPTAVVAMNSIVLMSAVDAGERPQSSVRVG